MVDNDLPCRYTSPHTSTEGHYCTYNSGPTSRPVAAFDREVNNNLRLCNFQQELLWGILECLLQRQIFH
ncbi:hypothetical protein SLEP1_g28232 [Rubroshorea leprosula]|uniref:Uncharacterized protein n=1 Tax=Rubroshorea leprosula TaxID=152421 RepID=A0AAV5K3W7_9ROSI|nr:hypothetical protein SLEP1_g28232 [Rubroshorea leprosula]